MSIPREFIELLLAKTNLVDLIRTVIPLQQKSSNNFFSCCPFHQEKSPSFSVSQTKQFYHCFGCGAHGNAIDFLIQYEHLSFPEAVQSLAHQAGMEVPHSAGMIKKDESLSSLYDLAKEVSAYYCGELRKASHAIDYLKNRGITGIVARQFHLGYALPGWSHVLDLFGKTESNKKSLLDTGLIIKKEGGGYYDRFRDRIIFPICDYRGRIIGFGGRVIDQGEPKYLNSPETPIFQKGRELYGLHQALTLHRALERIILVEGYMDVIALFQHGVTYAAATLGTATTSHHLQRLIHYTSEIIFCFDGDEAGRTAAWRALIVTLPFMNDQLQVRFLFLPNGEDPDSYIRKVGKDQFEKNLAASTSLSDFFFSTLGQQADLATIEGRARFAASALPHLQKLPDGIFQSIMLEELSKRARVDIDELRHKVRKGETIITPILPEQEVPLPKIKLPQPIRLALALLVQDPSLVKMIKDPLPKSELPAYSFLLNLIEIIQEKPHITTGGLLEHWRGQKEEAFIAKLAHWQHQIPDSGINHGFTGAMRQIITLILDEEINELLAKAGNNDLSESDKMALSTLISRKKAINTNTLSNTE